MTSPVIGSATTSGSASAVRFLAGGPPWTTCDSRMSFITVLRSAPTMGAILHTCLLDVVCSCPLADADGGPSDSPCAGVAFATRPRSRCTVALSTPRTGAGGTFVPPRMSRSIVLRRAGAATATTSFPLPRGRSWNAGAVRLTRLFRCTRACGSRTQQSGRCLVAGCRRRCRGLRRSRRSRRRRGGCRIPRCGIRCSPVTIARG
jgi:hypothetical protein